MRAFHRLARLLGTDIAQARQFAETVQARVPAPKPSFDLIADCLSVHPREGRDPPVLARFLERSRRVYTAKPNARPVNPSQPPRPPTAPRSSSPSAAAPSAPDRHPVALSTRPQPARVTPPSQVSRVAPTRPAAPPPPQPERAIVHPSTAAPARPISAPIPYQSLSRRERSALRRLASLLGTDRIEARRFADTVRRQVHGSTPSYGTIAHHLARHLSAGHDARALARILDLSRHSHHHSSRAPGRNSARRPQPPSAPPQGLSVHLDVDRHHFPTLQSIKHCPHGKPIVQTCAICNPERFRKLHGDPL